MQSTVSFLFCVLEKHKNILKFFFNFVFLRPRTLGFELLTKLDSFEKQMFEKGKEFQEEFLPPNVFTLDVDEAEYVEPKRKKQKGKKGGSRRK